MAGLLDRIRRAGRPPFHALTPAEARAAYERGAEVLDLPRAPLARVEGFELPGGDGAPRWTTGSRPSTAFRLRSTMPGRRSRRSHARDRGWPLALQLLITLGTTTFADTPSHHLFGNGFLLDAVTIEWFFDHAIDRAERTDWRFAPLLADDPFRRTLAEDRPTMTTPTLLPTRADFRYFDRLRVRWAEVDMQKIVFNGHYLMYFDTAIAGYWRALAMPYHDTMESLAGDMFVRKATVEYEGSARYDDLCEVGVRCTRIGKTSALFTLALFRGDTRLVWGELVYVFADPATQTSRPVPGALREVLEGFEAGQPMLDCRTGTWAALGRDAGPLRQNVFEAEQGVPMAMGGDASDNEAVHVVAYNRFGVPVGTGRLLVEAGEGGGQAGRVGRVAVRAELRGSGLGATVMRALAGAARARGDRELVLSAQSSALRFYERLGYTPAGAPFEEAGRMHQTMRLVL